MKFIIIFVSLLFFLLSNSKSYAVLGEGNAFFVPFEEDGKTLLWEKWTEDEKLKFIETSAKIYKGGNVKILRFYPEVAIDIFSFGAIEDKDGVLRFLFVDKIVEILNKYGIELIITISSENLEDHPLNTLIPKDLNKFKEYLKILVERYDGDTDFGVKMGSSYPDINGTGEVNSADWESSEDDKKAWAEKHIAEFFEVERNLDELLQKYGIKSDEYITFLKLVSPIIRNANKDAKILLSPINLKNLTKAVFNSKYGFIKEDPTLIDIATVYLFFDGNDLTTIEIFEKIKVFKQWFDEIGGENLELWIGGFNFGASPSTLNISNPTKGFCSMKICSEKTQSEQINKLLFRAISEGYKNFLYYGFIEEIYKEKYPFEHGGLVYREFNSNDVNVRAAYAVFGFLSQFFSEIEEWEFSQIFPLPTNTHAIKCVKGNEEIFVLWYDWSKEVSAGEDYGGLKKEVTFSDLKFEFADIIKLYPKTYDTKLSPFEMKGMWNFSSEKIKVEGGKLGLTIGREPILIREHTISAEDTKAEMVEFDVISEKVEEVSQKRGCSCTQNNKFNVAELFLLLCFILIYRLRKN